MMNISKLAKHYHISVRTIRYYEEKGLLSSYRNKQNIREFTKESIKRLELILFFKELNFSLAEIGDILSHMDYKYVEPIFSNRIETIKNQINELNNSLQILESVKKVMDSSHHNFIGVDDIINEQIYFQKNNERLVKNMGDASNIVIEIGTDLIPIADEKNDGTLITSIKKLRKEIETSHHAKVEMLRIIDNPDNLKHNEYRILKKDVEVTKSTTFESTYRELSDCIIKDLRTVLLSTLN